ncbi:MAG: hypothetical protein OEV78_11340 [Spirochaetia bacterium]|nr:hypothetical protein [Spirochaetia bacterium]
MSENIFKNYVNNLNIQKGIPKLVFIFLYVTLLIAGIIFIELIEINHRNLYRIFFTEKVSASLSNIEDNGNSSYEIYYKKFTEQLAETPNIKNIVFIIWSSEGTVLWHSNKLVEKIVHNNLENSNSMLKNSNFLDIPEKKFKPYDSFNKNKEKVITEPVITEFHKKIVHHFFKVSENKKNVYVEILREYDHSVSKNIYFYLFFEILIISGVFSYLTYLILRTYLKPVHQLVSSMESYNNNRDVAIVSNYPRNELGKMIQTYNLFLKNLSVASESEFDDSDGKNQKVIDYLQEMLTKKSIRKSEMMELLLFPKHPESDFRMFVTIEEHDHFTFILYVHFDINNIEANLEKHIIQDKFKELSQKTSNTREISEELFKDMVTHADLGPGFLLIRISEKEMEWVRSGPFHMYLVDSTSGESSLLEGGVAYLPTEMVSENKVSLKSKLLLVISDDIMELLNVDAFEFNNLVIWFTEYSPNEGKLILSEILHNIDRVNPDALKQSPMISLIRLK